MDRAKNQVRTGRTIRFGVLIFDGFPMLAFSAVIEPLRVGNILSKQDVFSWFIVSSGRPSVTASNGVAITVDHAAESAPDADYIVVCSGGDADRLPDKEPLKWIRRCLRSGAHVGSVADGTFYLARAGLMDGFACTLHWQSQPAFKEKFADITLKHDIYVVDRSRFTSAGGVGTLDMMLEIMAGHCGPGLAAEVAEWFVHSRIRSTADREKLQLHIRTGIHDDTVLSAVALMEDNIEAPISMIEIAGRLQMTRRQLENAFEREVGRSPSAYYRQIRLRHAKDLLEHSAMSVRDIGLACGYSSFSAFVRAFRGGFGETPKRFRP